MVPPHHHLDPEAGTLPQWPCYIAPNMLATSNPVRSDLHRRKHPKSARFPHPATLKHPSTVISSARAAITRLERTLFFQRSKKRPFYPFF